MLTILLGPILALLPRDWRESLPKFLTPNWRIATALSGIAEAAVALLALINWYSYSMVTWVSRGLDSASSGGLSRQANEQEIGFAAITIFAMHPLTWAIGYLAVEGTVRLLSATFSGAAMGVLPLYLIGIVINKITGSNRAKSAHGMSGAPQNSVRLRELVIQKLRLNALPEVPDQICEKLGNGELTLEIWSCQLKPDWVPPKVVRYGQDYFRLENTMRGTAQRPFGYVLRKLAAGVPGRTVLNYDPKDPIIDSKA